VSGGPTTYTVAVTGMTASGTVTASIAAGAAQDEAGNTSSASTSTDNSVSFDAAAPTVSISSPASGDTVSGTITVTASTADDTAVAGVQFFLDGVGGTEMTTAPYSVPWNTTTASNGSHTITAVARDAAGNLTTSAPITVTVANDSTPPTVSVSSPASGDTVSGTITVTASAADDTAVTGVQFFLDGNPGTDVTSAPFTAPWNTTTTTNGSHTLTAVARDAAGNRTTSAPVTVTVANDTTPPTVTITSPASGGTVSGTITVTVSAADDTAVTGVQFFLDGNPGTDVTTAPYSASWNTTTTTNGSHTLTAVARDAAGNRTTSAPVTITVANHATTRFEETSSAISAGPAGAWVLRRGEIATFSGGQAGSSNVTGATATLTFTGTAVTWIGLRCNVCGIASVSIDGGAAISVNTAGPAAVGSPGLTSEVVFTATDLAPGSHTLTITVTGTTTSGGAHIIVDAFDVTS
jgi:YD repeat-containing protein